MTEWDHRQLCPDGACVGLIGSDGTCKVCGRAAPNWGDERNRGLISEPGDYDGEADDDDEIEDDAPVANVNPGDPAWDERKLCPDDTCIGLIGDNGMCKVCGRRAA
ncbi:MAG TPA: hypothetical protein VIV40_21510 [Kofleriaceae bacterium]